MLVTTDKDVARQHLREVNAAISKLAMNAYRAYYMTLEIMIARYQHQMWRTIMSYEPRLAGAVRDKSYKLVLHDMIHDLSRLGNRVLAQAADVGFERCLNDLKLWGCVSEFTTPVVAPPGLSAKSIGENDTYLIKSLMPWMEEQLLGVKEPNLIPALLVAMHSRINMYGHFVWRTSERAFLNGLREYQIVKNKQPKMREAGTASSGDHDHPGRPGKRGGSAPSMIPGVAFVTNFKAGNEFVVGNGSNIETVQPQTATPDQQQLIVDEVRKNLTEPGMPSQLDELGTGYVASDENGIHADAVTLGNSKLYVNLTACHEDTQTYLGEDPTDPSLSYVPPDLFGSKMTEEGYMRITVDHEMGHVLMANITRSQMMQFASYVTPEIASKISGYAASNMHEAFAEAYTAYVHHDMKNIFIRDYFDRLLQGKSFVEAASSDRYDSGIAVIMDDFDKGPTYIMKDGTRIHYPVKI
jgi:hypothetical protein